MEQNVFGCNLIIDTEGDCPTTITSITKIPASEILVKNKPYINSRGQEIPQKLNHANLWIYHSERVHENEEKYLNTALENIFNLLKEKRRAFKKVFSKYPKRHILCYGYYYDFHQYFLLKKELIKLMSSFEIDIEFDVYFFDEK